MKLSAVLLVACLHLAAAAPNPILRATANGTQVLSATANGTRYSREELRFPSGDAASGRIELRGELLLPVDANCALSSPLGCPTAVLLHGAGGYDRWEDIAEEPYPHSLASPQLHPLCGERVLRNASVFRDLASVFLDSGYAVLVYDKRSCVESDEPVCTYKACERDGEKDCVIVPRLRYDDYVKDAVASLSHAVTLQKVRSDRLLIVGHGQGATIAPIAAMEFTTSPPLYCSGGVTCKVDRTLLLMAYLTPVQELMQRQIGTRLKVCEGFASQCGFSPEELALRLECELASPLLVRAIEEVKRDFPRMGAIVAEEGADTEKCYDGMCRPAGFWLQWIERTDVQAKEQALKTLDQLGSEILGINSATDREVSPPDYEPLAQLLRLLERADHRDLRQPTLTHNLAPSDLSSARLSAEVFYVISSWL